MDVRRMDLKNTVGTGLLPGRAVRGTTFNCGTVRLENVLQHSLNPSHFVKSQDGQILSRINMREGSIHEYIPAFFARKESVCIQLPVSKTSDGPSLTAALGTTHFDVIKNRGISYNPDGTVRKTVFWHLPRDISKDTWEQGYFCGWNIFARSRLYNDVVARATMAQSHRVEIDYEYGETPVEYAVHASIADHVNRMFGLDIEQVPDPDDMIRTTLYRPIMFKTIRDFSPKLSMPVSSKDAPAPLPQTVTTIRQVRGRVKEKTFSVEFQALGTALRNLAMHSYSSISIAPDPADQRRVLITERVILPELEAVQDSGRFSHKLSVESAVMDPKWITEDMDSTYNRYDIGLETEYLPIMNFNDGRVSRRLLQQIFGESREWTRFFDDCENAIVSAKPDAEALVRSSKNISEDQKQALLEVLCRKPDLGQGTGPDTATDLDKQLDRWSLGGMTAAYNKMKGFAMHPSKAFSAVSWGALQAWQWYQHGLTDTVLTIMPAIFWGGTFLEAGMIPLITGRTYPMIFTFYLASTLNSYIKSGRLMGMTFRDLLYKEATMKNIQPAFARATINAVKITAKCGIDPGFMVTPTGAKSEREVEHQPFIMGNAWRLMMNAACASFGSIFLINALNDTSHITSWLEMGTYFFNTFFPILDTSLKLVALNRDLACYNDPSTGSHAFLKGTGTPDPGGNPDIETFNVAISARDSAGNQRTIDNIVITRNADELTATQLARDNAGNTKTVTSEPSTGCSPLDLEAKNPDFGGLGSGPYTLTWNWGDGSADEISLERTSGLRNYFSDLLFYMHTKVAKSDLVGVKQRK